MNEKMTANVPMVWAVITNWNGFTDTSECLTSLLASPYPNLRVVIVDNGSTDNSPD